MGLYPDEMALLEKVPLKQGRVLLLCVGDGREAISLVRMGFEVTGVDFVPEIVEKAKNNAVRCGLRFEGLVQEISKLEVPAGSYDLVWLSVAMYSCVPTRRRRVKMLKRIRRALRPEGHFLCQFHFDTRAGFSRRGELIRRTFAFFTLGNLWYEKGDMLWNDLEFLHAFSSEEELRSEFEEGGFRVVHIHTPERGMRGGAVLRNGPLNSLYPG